MARNGISDKTKQFQQEEEQFLKDISQIIKPGDGTIADDISNIFQANLFFDLMHWTVGRLGRKQEKFTVNFSHFFIAEQIRTSGMFKVSRNEFERGLVSLGTMVQAHTYGIQYKSLERIQERCAGLRVEVNKKILTSLLSCIDTKKDKASKKVILDQINLYGANMYGSMLFCHVEGWGDKDVSRGVKHAIIPTHLTNSCRNILRDVPDEDKAMRLLRNSNNHRVTIYLPKEICFLNYELSNLIHTYHIKSDIFRLAYVTGLYIVAKMTKDKRIPIEEFCFNNICRNLSKYIMDKD